MEGNRMAVQEDRPSFTLGAGPWVSLRRGRIFPAQGCKVGLSPFREFCGSSGKGERTGNWKGEMKEKRQAGQTSGVAGFSQ